MSAGLVSSADALKAAYGRPPTRAEMLATSMARLQLLLSRRPSRWRVFACIRWQRDRHWERGFMAALQREELHDAEREQIAAAVGRIA